MPVDDEQERTQDRAARAILAPRPTELPDDLVLWDETLRDGEKTPGVHLDADEKVEIGQLLDGAGVEVLCCGVPLVSPRELASVRAVASQGLRNAQVLAAQAARRAGAPVTRPSAAGSCARSTGEA